MLDHSSPKTCTMCGQTKSRSAFSKRARALDGLCYWCKSCYSAYAKSDKRKARLASLPPRKRTNDRWKRRLRYYGVSKADFLRVLEKQGGRCPICTRHVGENDAVDHCHLSGAFRGIIHRTCNVLIGHARDDHATLSRAAEYLRGFSGYAE